MAAILLGKNLIQPGLALEARSRAPIPNKTRLEMHPGGLRDLARCHEALHPRAVRRSATATYNCIGMVVANRRAWVEPADLQRVLLEDGFRRRPGPDQVQPGDVVVYRDDEGEVAHAGVILEVLWTIEEALPFEKGDRFRVLSKWGEGGEYEHNLTDVPSVFGKPAEYWTDRRTL